MQERETSDILFPELWEEVLVRLPVRSLLTLKSVSKTFLSLIRNPSFASLHFTRFNKINDSSDSHSNSKYADLVLLTERSGDSRDFFYLVHRSIDPISTARSKYLVHDDDACAVVGYVDGLILLIRKYSTLEKCDILLCNPSIRKSIVVPPPPLPRTRDNRIFGFGYNPALNDYVVVSVVQVTHDTMCKGITSVEVYSLRSMSWRIIGYNLLSRGWYLGESICLTGVLRWLGCFNWNLNSAGNSYLSHVISFDLREEQFRYEELPDCIVDDNGEFTDEVKFLVVFRGSLAVLYIYENEICVWAKKERNWIKEWTVESASGLFVLLRGTERDTEFYEKAIFSEEKNELLFAGCHGIVSYNIETQELIEDRSQKFVHKCVDSLLWIESLPHWNPLGSHE